MSLPGTYVLYQLVKYKCGLKKNTLFQLEVEGWGPQKLQAEPSDSLHSFHNKKWILLLYHHPWSHSYVPYSDFLALWRQHDTIQILYSFPRTTPTSIISALTSASPCFSLPNLKPESAPSIQSVTKNNWPFFLNTFQFHFFFIHGRFCGGESRSSLFLPRVFLTQPKSGLQDSFSSSSKVISFPLLPVISWQCHPSMVPQHLRISSSAKLTLKVGTNPLKTTLPISLPNPSTPQSLGHSSPNSHSSCKMLHAFLFVFAHVDSSPQNLLLPFLCPKRSSVSLKIQQQCHLQCDTSPTHLSKLDILYGTPKLHLNKELYTVKLDIFSLQTAMYTDP